MKNAAARNLMAAAAAVATVNAFCGVPVATADEAVIHTFGSAAELINGDVVQAWTISDLRPSSDAIPYPVTGTLWEATATDEAIRGSVQPVVSNLNARARSGQTYRVLFGAATPQGVNPAVLAQGQKTTGKIYFDVVGGDSPDSVFYSAAGGPDLAVWVAPPPAPPRPSSSGAGANAGSPIAAAPAATPAGGAASSAASSATSPTTPVPAAAPAAAGSQGTPIQEGSQGTPIQEGSQGTPISPPTAGTTPAPPTTAAAPPAPSTNTGVSPTPAAAEQTPAAQGSAGTPVPHGSGQTAGTAAPTTTAAVPPPA
ncbi:MAG: MPT63 family protein [Mycolicibacterium sp.]|uniref:MPT63 family protein n=1 Tax=Mycolicibacterium sp. TaxID=2320850 RepID=UPI003D147B2D